MRGIVKWFEGAVENVLTLAGFIVLVVVCVFLIVAAIALSFVGLIVGLIVYIVRAVLLFLFAIAAMVFVIAANGISAFGKMVTKERNG